MVFKTLYGDVSKFLAVFGIWYIAAAQASRLIPPFAPETSEPTPLASNTSVPDVHPWALLVAVCVTTVGLQAA